MTDRLNEPSNFPFNDPSKFPPVGDVSTVMMLEDSSLRVKLISSKKDVFYHSTLVCPPNTAMHEWLLAISGPLEPGNIKFIGIEVPENNPIAPKETQMDWF